MRKGDSGPEIDALQHALEGMDCLPQGIGSLADTDGAGVFGENTEKAINRLRTLFGWDEHGRATLNTLRAIRAQIAALQIKLAALGLYTGEAHGSFDQATRQALLQFQANFTARTLSATGRLDAATRAALALSPPYSFDEVFCSELDAVNKGRDEAGQQPEKKAAESGNPMVRAHQTRLLGLAFSGGGIRSATFNLGVLQALSRLGLLRYVDYLSTVSGGGYIGGWLHAWVHREPKGIRGVEDALAVDANASSHEPRQVKWLRQYSNYLTPRVGLTSADTMTGVATWLRNVLLNQTILGALGMLVLCVPWFVLMWVQTPTWMQGALPVAVAASGVLLVAAAAFVAGVETGAIEGGAPTGGASPEPGNTASRRHAAGKVIGMVAGAAVLLGTAAPFAARHPTVPWWGLALALGLAQSIFVVVGWRRGLGKAQKLREKISKNGIPGSRANDWTTGAALIAGMALAALIAWLLSQTTGDTLQSPLPRMLLVIFGPPATLLALLLGITAHIGLAGRGLRESSREWWSRTGGILISIMLGWLAISGVALLASYGVLYAGAWITALGGIAWLATTVAGVILGGGQSTGQGKGSWKEALAVLAPWIFVAGLLVLIAFALHAALIKSGNPNEDAVCVPVPEISTPGLQPAYRISLDLTPGADSASGEVASVKSDPGCSLARYAREAGGALANSTLFLFILAVSLVVLAILLGRRVDINVFAFHMFYRNRLERCYLGASRTGPRGHPFTGLDAGDSPKLANLRRNGTVQRPYPLINTALNIARSSNLAWQERKAASFLFTPEFCGYQLPGSSDADIAAYQKTACYVDQLRDKQATGAAGSGPGWISLGMPITVSGAAASPNAGYHTNLATAFLMTVFNVRLGWWIQNPRSLENWSKPGPQQSIPYLLKELHAATTDSDEFVYVSDGGHFENLGIYELVRRRCRYIIACDAGCDPNYTFEDLGNAIRKCQIDLGIEIEIDPGALVPDATTGHSQFHCAVGTIHYERLDPVAAPGYLLYLKTSLSGDESTDVKQYQAEHAAFPHESTGDQWYSESQFESYRKLGQHVTMNALELAREGATLRQQSGTKSGSPTRELACDPEQLFHALSERWYPPSRAVQDSFPKHGEELAKVFDHMREDANLSFLDAQIYPEWLKLSDRAVRDATPTTRSMFPQTQDELRAGFYLCNTLIQLMESIYLSLRLEEEHGHPDNRGWMNLFRHWSWAGMFRVTWAVCAATYGARFQQFCRRHLGLESGVLTLGDAAELSDPGWEGKINFVEQDHVRRIIIGAYAATPDALAGLDKTQILSRSNAWAAETGHARFKVQALEMRVGDPHGKEQDFTFPIGFALLSEADSTGQHSLIYYRIQDHLRRMGLGRHGLQVLRARYGDMYIDMPVELQHLIRDADPDLLQHLWHSALWAAPSGQAKRV